MSTSKQYARIAGLFLLGSLASLFLVLRFLPGFDARQEYFAGYFSVLVAMRASFGISLRLMILTGLLLAIAGIALASAFERAAKPRHLSGMGLAGAGAGFILAGVLGLPALRSLGQAGEAAAGDWQVLIGEVYPWASGSQTVLLFFGLGGLAVGLLIAGLSLISAGAINRRLLIAGAIAPFLLLVIAAFIPGAPLFWLVGGIPTLFWSIEIGAHLLITGRVRADG